MALQWTMEQMKQDDEETMDRLAPLLAAKGFDRNGLPLHHHQVASVAAEVGLGRDGNTLPQEQVTEKPVHNNNGKKGGGQRRG